MTFIQCLVSIRIASKYILKDKLTLNQKHMTIGAIIASFAYCGTLLCLACFVGNNMNRNCFNIINVLSALVSIICVSIYINRYSMRRERLLYNFITIAFNLVGITIISGAILSGIMIYTYLGYYIRNLNSSLILLAILMILMTRIQNQIIKTIGANSIINDLYCDCTLYYGEKCVMVKALLDSGNSLYEPISKKPVCVIEKDAVKSMQNCVAQGMFVVNFKSVGMEEGRMYGFEFSKMLIKTKQIEKMIEKPKIAVYKGKLSESKGYQMLLHRDYMRGK